MDMNDMVVTSIDLVFYIFVILFNIYYLFPRYMKTNSLWKYFIMLILSVGLLTPIKGFIVYIFGNHRIPNNRGNNIKSPYTFLSLFIVAGISSYKNIL
ncbi:MAG: hypothetical protein R2771_07905 [Saprospiraceae bacterium]